MADLDALAKKHGGSVAAPSNLDALAAKHGGSAGATPPNTVTANPEDFTDKPKGSALGRFVGGAAEYLNPVTIATGLYGAVRHPLDTATAAAGQMGEQWSQAKGLVGQSRYVEAGGHAVAGSIPLIGPAAAKAGERIGSGDWAGGAGETLGLLAPTAVPLALRGTTAMAAKAGRLVPGAVDRLATSLETGAANRVADVMSPKVGANKVRFGNQAAKVAPAIANDLATDGAPMSRSGLAAHVEAKLGEAEAGLDAVSDARGSTKAYDTKPILQELQAKRDALVAPAIEGHQVSFGTTGGGPLSGHVVGHQRGQAPTATTVPGDPIGANVEPAPSAARIAAIDKVMAEVKQLGPVARYESLRRIRQSWDQVAKAKYAPAVTADFLTKNGEASGAMDATGVLRDYLAQQEPATAAANATYSVYRTANDVLKAAEETERTRPKVGRAIMARLTGALIGGQQGGTAGALFGYAGAPIVDAALNAGATTRLQTAALMTKLAQVVRTGDVSAVDAVLGKLRAIQTTARRGLLVGQATSPSGSQRQTEAPVTP